MLCSMVMLWMCTNMLCVGDRATLARDERVRYLSRMNIDATGAHGLTDCRPPKKNASWGLTNKMGQANVLRLGYRASHGRIESPLTLGGTPRRNLSPSDIELKDLPTMHGNPAGDAPAIPEPKAAAPIPIYDPRDALRADAVPGSFSLYTPMNAQRGYGDEEESKKEVYDDEYDERAGAAEEGKRRQPPAIRANPPLESVVPGKIIRYLEDKADGTLPDYIPAPPAGPCRPPPCLGSRTTPLRFLPCFKPLQWVLITFCEQSSFCEWWGSFFLECESYRQSLIWFALLTDLASMVLITISIFGISDQEDIVKLLPWATGSLKVNGHKMNVWFGLNGFVLETASSANFAFKDGFHYFDDISDEDCEDYSLCGSCGEVSLSMVESVSMALVTMFPTVFTDILRMYPQCKFFESFLPRLSSVPIDSLYPSLMVCNIYS